MFDKTTCGALVSLAVIIGAHVNAQETQKGDGATHQRLIPSCAGLKAPKRLSGWFFKLPVPKGAVVRRTSDIDYREYFFGYGPKEGRVWLSWIWGPQASNGQPPEAWVARSVQVTRQEWKSGTREGVDVSGKLAAGRRWRYFGTFGESMMYTDATEEAAAYFDAIIDSACAVNTN